MGIGVDSEQSEWTGDRPVHHDKEIGAGVWGRGVGGGGIGERSGG